MEIINEYYEDISCEEYYEAMEGYEEWWAEIENDAINEMLAAM